VQPAAASLIGHNGNLRDGFTRRFRSKRVKQRTSSDQGALQVFCVTATLRLQFASVRRWLRSPAEAKPGPDYQRRKLQLGLARKSCNASADVLEPIFGMNLGKYVHADRQKPAAKNFVRPQILQL
jgi:hypothetical protein